MLHLDLYEDRERLTAMSEKARLCAREQFDLRVIKQRYTDLFETLM